MFSELRAQRRKDRYQRSLSEEEKIGMLNRMIAESSHIVFLGGAGVSTESGIPDFRSKDGLYKKTDRRFAKYRPEYLLSDQCLHREPEVFFAYFRKNLDSRKVQPNAAHRKLTEMERFGKLDGVITQNIDGLHQKAGSRNVQEIHGSALRSYCVSCRKKYGPDFIFENADPVPKCPACGRMVRPDVTLYGEILPEPAYGNAVSLLQNADCLIIGGTSLEVGSAAGLAHTYHGKYLVIINKGKTKMEGKADLVFHDSIGKILGMIDLHTPEI
ncbi:MAG: NAD-dependent protein deacylase [Lachnospiraceae bacterium]|nr:NAD-dependent protein deacylase [Lachnospiraceae bacterium]